VRRIRRAQSNVRALALAEVEAALASSGLAPLTIRTYQYNLRLFWRWLVRTELAFEALTPADLRSYRQQLGNVERLKPATINQRLHTLRWLCGWAHRRGDLTTDPAREVTAVRVMRRYCPRGLTEAEVHKLCRAVGQSQPRLRARNAALLQLLLQAGLRVGEAVNLTIADVTLRDRSGQVRIQGKGGKEREVPLNASVRRALQAYLATRPVTRPTDPLLLSQEQRPLSERAAQKLFQGFTMRAKLARPVTPHSLRHCFALNYLRDNPGQLVELAQLLGHESLDTTAIYTQPSAETLAATPEKSPLNVFG
jgi:integrase/recombinase XerC